MFECRRATDTLGVDLDAKVVFDGLVVLAAGAVAGAVNAAAGGGSLITFPTRRAGCDWPFRR